jgi:hypothetical protein
MSAMKDKKLISLQQIEGAISPHTKQLERALTARKEALEHVHDVAGLASYIGSVVESLGMKEDWAICKEIFPGVEVHFIYNRGDEEFPGSLRVLYSGDRIKSVSGDDLASITIPYVSHMLRYIRETNPGKQLPEVCYRV